MKAYVYGANGPEIAEIAKPSPKGTQVLVKVSAVGAVHIGFHGIFSSCWRLMPGV